MFQIRKNIRIPSGILHQIFPEDKHFHMIAVCQFFQPAIIGLHTAFHRLSRDRRDIHTRLFQIRIILLAQLGKSITKRNLSILFVHNRHHWKTAVFEFCGTASAKQLLHRQYQCNIFFYFTLHAVFSPFPTKVQTMAGTKTTGFRYTADNPGTIPHGCFGGAFLPPRKRQPSPHRDTIFYAYLFSAVSVPVPVHKTKTQSQVQTA